MVPWPDDGVPGQGVVAVTVNWNTRGLLARLLFGLTHIVARGTITGIVVVDNASDDGSVELGRALDEAGLIHLLANREQRYHGPGLTQAVDHLVEGASAGRDRPELIWALDTDVLILRPDVVVDATAALRRFDAVWAADPDDYVPAPPHLTTEPLALCSTLFDPARVWRPEHRPFLEDGEPAAALREDLSAAGHRLVSFPFCADGYVVHLGRATLAEVARRGDTGNTYADWAATHHEPHYGLRPDGQKLVAQFEERYRAAVPDDDVATIVDALSARG